MKLKNLYRSKSVLNEDYRVAKGVNPERLLPTTDRGVLATGGAFKSKVLERAGVNDFDEFFELLRKLEEEGNWRQAYELAKAVLTKSYVSGLNRQPVSEKPTDKYIYIRGDIDRMKWMNDETGLTHDGVNVIIQHLGSLIMKHLEAKPGIDLAKATLNYVEGSADFDRQSGSQIGKYYHPHGDEFGGAINVSGLSDEQIGWALALTFSGLMNVADDLAARPFYTNKDAFNRQDRSDAVRATVSFGVSMKSGITADKILQKTKNSGVRYALTVDQELIDRYVRPNPKAAAAVNGIMNRAQGAQTVIQTEAENKALKAVLFRPGCLLLELDPLAIPRHEMLELENHIREKRHYLNDPKGYCPVSGYQQTMYLPLKEPYNGVGCL